MCVVQGIDRINFCAVQAGYHGCEGSHETKCEDLYKDECKPVTEKECKTVPHCYTDYKKDCHKVMYWVWWCRLKPTRFHG